jgi:hypothetical protein
MEPPFGSHMKPGSVDFDLRGKDWLTEAEAAHYCGVSLRQFQEHARQFNARRFMGKKLYSRIELFDAIGRAPLWHARPQASALTGRSELPPHLQKIMDRLSGERIRPYKPRKRTPA